jgi:tetratricopeptide (TPR) repeat protein
MVPLCARLRPLVVASLLVGASLLMGAGPSAAQSGSPQAPLPDSALAPVDTLRAQGDFRGALSRMSSLRGEYGDEVELLWRMALTRVDIAKTLDEKGARTQQYEQALTLAEAALTTNASNAHAHLAKAVVEGRMALDAGTRERVQRSRLVKKHADRAIELDSTLDGAYHTRARWNREVSDLNFFERAVVKTVYGGLPESSFEQAVRDFKRAIELHDERFHRLELGKTYIKMDQPDKAREQLQLVTDMPAREPFDQRYLEEATALLNDLE